MWGGVDGGWGQVWGGVDGSRGQEGSRVDGGRGRGSGRRSGLGGSRVDGGRGQGGGVDGGRSGTGRWIPAELWRQTSLAALCAVQNGEGKVSVLCPSQVGPCSWLSHNLNACGGSHLGTGRGIVRVLGYGHGQGRVLLGEVSLG